MDVDEVVLQLYGLPPEEFMTTTRNELAKRARECRPGCRGCHDQGVEEATLAEATLAAWLAN